MTDQEMIQEINRLRKEKNAVILTHNYQIPEIQDIADFVGDSLELCQAAVKSNAKTVILNGVSTLAESIKILAWDKKVLIPVSDAVCPMADRLDIENLRKFKKKNPSIPVVSYINSPVDIKAESDICCTTANALSVVGSLSSDKILFISDKNLGEYIARQLPEKQINIWQNLCNAHYPVKEREVEAGRKQHPEALLLVHPKCGSEVVKKADFVGGSSEIISYVNENQSKSFIIGTEMGVLHRLRKNNPDKKFHLLSPALVCFNMKKTTLKDVYFSLLKEEKEILISKELSIKALKPLDTMLKTS
ncbi:quinolinate synthetase [Natronincola peptidivorans]|uniref:Quinolinate synthase n=1 Tax=Natronincola peptidivorans TaxID=426128 RepID=A0A1I0GX98_9FIRM|nr:quinolinate synthase NadA [Natronincola peptidivorans]SET75163.1 quinolinate synthetase [Natronincola peptidivorans]